MVGYPKHLNTKEDYLYVKNNFPKSIWLDDFKKLLAMHREWFFVKELATKEEGTEDSTHKVVDTTEQDGDVTITKYAQFEYKVNPNSKLLSIGFTEEEVKAIIG